MHDEFDASAARRRMALLFAIAALGLGSLVGSGGGLSPGLPSDCPTGLDCSAPPPAPAATITPAYVTALVGTAATYTVTTKNLGDTPAYQWSRSSDGGLTWVEVPGATAATFTLDSVNLSDDGTQLRAVAQSRSTLLSATAVGHLVATAVPGIVFTDTEFQSADWLVTPFADDNAAAPAQTVEQVPAGGNPGAYRRMVFTLPAQVSAGRVFYTSLTSTYDPATQGAIHVIDYAEDSYDLRPASNQTLSALLLEQGGRHYVANSRLGQGGVLTTSWGASQNAASLLPQDFTRFDGPACQAGESCPDFSAQGAPMQFGYWRISFGTQGNVITHGIDNWRVTLWPR